MDVVTSNAFTRVLEIQTELGCGTAFTLDQDGQQYLVTARHLLPPGVPDPEVRLSNRHLRRTLRLELLSVFPATADVAVSPLVEPLTETADYPLPATGVGLLWSQRTFFLGFPYGLATVLGAPQDRIAFVKGALFSGSDKVGGVDLLYLDGMNNPGFSGGPVVFNRDEDGLRPQVCGVIAGYRFERQPVYQGTTPVAEMEANTGIIVATDIRHVTDAIVRASPEGA